MKSKPSCQIICNVLASQGVRDAIISPGSRNTPFILALDDLNNIEKHVVIDERSASFMALGMAQLSRRPVVLCCTSGTALLNYAPAVAEAYYQGVPLIIVSADRPAEWIDQDDSQTLRQFEALRNYVKASFDIPDFPAEDENMTWYVNRIANEAYLSCISDNPGPVHINMHFSEPLAATHQGVSPRPLIIKADTQSCLPPQVIKSLAQDALNKRVLIVAGQHYPSHRLNRAMAILSHIPNIAIWAESISNIHIAGITGCIDRTLTAIDTDDEKFSPDIIISFGGSLVSRKAKEYLRKQKDCAHWAVGYSRTHIADPFMHLRRLIECAPEVFFSHFANAVCRLHPKGTYAEVWQEAGLKALHRHTAKLNAAPWSALKAFAIIMTHIPTKANLQLSNGTSIRYAQLFDSRHIHASYCNRGVSGIDGSTSTAMGAAWLYGHQTLLISGDMSFAYDIGALASPYVNPDMKIIVINNQGGEIFRFIKTTSALPEREHYFSVNPILPLPDLAKAYGFNYWQADNEQSLRASINNLFAPSLKPSILEVKVNADISARTLNDYFN